MGDAEEPAHKTVRVGEEEFALTLAPMWEAGVGGELFPGAVVLAEFLAQRDWTGRRVLELGAGATGLPGILCCRRGAAVTFTDFETVLPWLEPNVKANCPGGLASLKTLDWRDLDSAEASDVLRGPYDAVLAADCVYDKVNAEALVEVLVALLSAGSGTPEVLVGDSSNITPAWAAFRAAAERAGFALSRVAGQEGEHMGVYRVEL